MIFPQIRCTAAVNQKKVHRTKVLKLLSWEIPCQLQKIFFCIVLVTLLLRCPKMNITQDFFQNYLSCYAHTNLAQNYCFRTVCVRVSAFLVASSAPRANQTSVWASRFATHATIYRSLWALWARNRTNLSQEGSFGGT